MARRRRTLYERYAPYAKAEAQLATSPERRGLRALLLEALSTRDAEIGAAHTTSRVLRGAIKQADPRVAKIYQDAGRGLSAATGDYAHPAMRTVAGDFSQLGPAAGSIGEAARAESDAAQRRITEGETRARLELQNQGTAAAAGEVSAVRAANDRYHSDAGKILQQLTGLDQEEGLRASTALGKYVEDALGRRTTQRGQTLSHQDRAADRRSREQIAAANREAKTKPKSWASDADQRSLRQTIGKARTYAETFKSTGTSRSEAAAILSTGQDAQPVFDTRKSINGVANPRYGKPLLNPDGTPRRTGKVPAIGDELALSVALDVAYDGHISRRNQRLLHKNRYRISPLGLVTYGQARRKRAKNAPPYQPPNNTQTDPKFGPH